NSGKCFLGQKGSCIQHIEEGSKEKMFSKETIKRKHGFTLVELIVVLVIITVIASVAVPSIAGYIIKMKQMARDEMAAALFKISQTAITDIYSAGNQEELEYKGQVD